MNQSPPSLARPYAFPPAWTWLFDELVPAYVKKTYSPRETWRDKPFTSEDAVFFGKGVQELSELFTGERPSVRSGLPDYFSHAKFRSAYLLYFLPLQAAKFSSLFSAHSEALEAALAHGRKTRTLRVVDLGAGPGTASIALALHLLTRTARDLPEQIEFEWFDTSGRILEDGRALMEQIAEQFPALRGRTVIRTKTTPWWNYLKSEPQPPSLILMGNVLNEAGSRHGDSPAERLATLLKVAGGAGILMVEPASRSSSQLISKTRDDLIASEVIKPYPSSLWGPCLHAGACPLAEGRDWCHFSVPAEIPGKWFARFSKLLGSERHWLKFSYLWLSSHDSPAPIPATALRRVISDPIRKVSGGSPGFVMLCEPERSGRLVVDRSRAILRGEIVNPDRAMNRKPAGPLSGARGNKEGRKGRK